MRYFWENQKWLLSRIYQKIECVNNECVKIITAQSTEFSGVWGLEKRSSIRTNSKRIESLELS